MLGQGGIAVDAVVPAARPELEAFREAMQLEDELVVRELMDVLGAKLVAYIAGVTETRAVHAWADGDRTPREPVPQRLRLALQVVWMIARQDGPRVAQAWFQGLNPELDDRSPARLLREGELSEVGPQVVAAARAFVVGG
jgi:hypothetical protein